MIRALASRILSLGLFNNLETSVTAIRDTEMGSFPAKLITCSVEDRLVESEPSLLLRGSVDPPSKLISIY